MQLSLTSRLKDVTKNVSLVLWVLFLVLLILEGLTLKHSLAVVSRARYADPGAQPSKSAFINTESYNAAVDRIVRSESFVPAEVTGPNPFLPVANVVQE